MLIIITIVVISQILFFFLSKATRNYWVYRSWRRTDRSLQHCHHLLSDGDGLGILLYVCVVAVSGAVVRLQQLVQHTVSVSMDYVLTRLSRINMFLSCLPRDAMHSAAYAVVRCLSVCRLCRRAVSVCLSDCHVRVLYRKE